MCQKKSDPSISSLLRRDDKLFQKACPEVLRDRIFNGALVSKKIRFFQKACPEVLRDRIFNGASV
jgi:hypothetical protein